MSEVRALGCILCHKLGLGQTPAEAHHVFDSAARSDYLTIPLCSEHHRGKAGFHGMGQRTFERVYKTSEAQLLAATIEKRWRAGA